MTIEELRAALAAIKQRQIQQGEDRAAGRRRFGADLELDHEEADALLLQFINDAEATRLFEEIGKWYA